MPKATAIAVCNLDARNDGVTRVVVRDRFNPDIYHVKYKHQVKPEQIVYTSGMEV